MVLIAQCFGVFGQLVSSGTPVEVSVALQALALDSSIVSNLRLTGSSEQSSHPLVGSGRRVLAPTPALV